MLRSRLRGYDLAGRYGGEEFAILLLQARGMDALNVAEHLQTGLQAFHGAHSLSRNSRLLECAAISLFYFNDRQIRTYRALSLNTDNGGARSDALAEPFLRGR